MLERWLGLKPGELDYTCVGINHQAFYLKLQHDGKDMYPALREAVKRPEVAAEEPVRIEVFRHLKYFITESSGHNSEYLAWFRKRPDLIERYCTHGTGWNPGEHAYILNEYLNSLKLLHADNSFVLVFVKVLVAVLTVFPVLMFVEIGCKCLPCENIAAISFIVVLAMPFLAKSCRATSTNFCLVLDIDIIFFLRRYYCTSLIICAKVLFLF